MSVSLKNYTLKHFAIVLLLVIAVWAGAFYTFIREELYDNIDDGLKNQKIQIIRKAFIDEKIVRTEQFDFNQFRISEVPESQYVEGNTFRTEQFFMEYEEGFEPYRVLETYFTDREGRYRKLEIRTSMVEEDEFLENLIFALICLYLLLVVSIVIVNTLVLGKVWKPFYRTLERLGNYQFGKNEEKTQKITYIDEFDMLNSEIDKMIHRNEYSFNQQKQFIENASHELQTPLAIAINKLELLIGDESLTEDKRLELSDVSDSLHRLVKLNRSLLMLSRIDNNQFAQKQLISFNEVSKKVASEFTDLFEYKAIDFSLVEKQIFETEMNPDLAYILISNLLRNALKHNKKEGKIEVTILANVFSVKNTSTADMALDTNQIFNRFYKTNQDHTSTGLGLAIVKTIMDNHTHLHITYHYENGLHEFRLTRQI
ncbi:sensor histidine kinase [Capnocytophaga canimorsus]|uniref:sensor histidine kinase n=1 Tax=Capnocytophaga canimorsus TaxID=28188 RepID=UPI0037CED105